MEMWSRESLCNAEGSYIIYNAAREVGALESHGMEEEWRLLSLRARIACAICQIYIILRERNDWEEGVVGGREGGVNKSNNDLKNNVMEWEGGGRAGQ